jgi:hypothetical protein
MRDTHEDMVEITRLRIAQDALAKRTDEDARERLRRADEMEQEALRLSQESQFDQARRRVQDAAQVLRDR